VRRRSPKSEAVTISEPKDGLSYADVMKRVVQEVDLKEIGVEVSGSRRTKSGAILLEVREKEAADRLADCIRASLGGKATISRPSRTTKVLVVNIADWMEDDCVMEDIKRADTGLALAKIVIRSNSGGGKMAIVDAPMDAAVRLSEQAHIRVGFNRCRVKLLEKRQQQCYRCQAVGHLAASCTVADQGKRCYRCRELGHIAADCSRSTPSGKLAGMPAHKDRIQVEDGALELPVRSECRDFEVPTD